MKKIITIITFSLLTVLCALSLVACVGTPEGEASIMTIDINPSVEFVLDKDSKVVSITALNDDGSILINGEAFVGLSAEDATEKYLNLCIDTGYLSAGVDASKNGINISLSGDSEYATKLKENIKTKATKVIENSEIVAKIEDIKTIAKSKVEETLKNCGFSDEDLQDLDIKDLVAKLGEERKATADLITEDLRNVYYQAKETKIEFANNETLKSFLDSSNNALLKVVAAAYNTAYSVYETANTALIDAENALLDKDGNYQKLVDNVYAKKAEVLKAKNDLASIEDKESKEYKAKEAIVTTAELVFNEAEKALDAPKQLISTAKAALERAKNTLDSAYKTATEALSSQERESFLQEAETKLNEYKTKFFEDFENEHKEDITAIKAKLDAQKKTLKDQIK